MESCVLYPGLLRTQRVPASPGSPSQQSFWLAEDCLIEGSSWKVLSQFHGSTALVTHAHVRLNGSHEQYTHRNCNQGFVEHRSQA